MSMHTDVRKHHQSHAEDYVKRARGGAAKHPDEAEDKKLIRSELKDVEIKPKRKRRGGMVTGKKPVMRLDKRARGGAMPGKHKHGKVNIVVNAGGGEQAKQDGIKQGMQIGARLGARQAAQQMTHAAPPPRPPMAPPGAGAMPPGPPGQGMPGPRPMPNGPMPAGLKDGGKVPHLDGGAGGGLARLEKQGKTAPGTEKIKVREHERRKRGGACD